MAKKTKAVARSKRKAAPKKKTVALAKVEPVVEAEVLPMPTAPERLLAESNVRLDALGLVELKATPEEERVLARQPDPFDVCIKPTGEVYLPHPVLTKWVNEAFGRGAWTLVQAGKPSLVENTVTCPYILYVHGRPVAFANGEQEYHESNRNQSYGDALESTYASALRRCTKHLGIGLEMWDRRWSRRWRAEHAVEVSVKVRKKNRDGQWEDDVVTQWRRLDDPPLKNEIEGGRQRRQPPASHQEDHAAMDEPISEAKRDRFWRIARRTGRSEGEVKDWLARVYNLKSTAEIRNRDYDAIMRTIESEGDLP